MYKEDNGNIIVRKHWVLLFLYLVKFIFILFFAIILSFIGIFYAESLGRDLVVYVIFPAVFLLVNYSFFKLILAMIEFYNYLFIIA